MGQEIEFRWDNATGNIVEETVYRGDQSKTLLFIANEARKLMQPYVPELNHILVKGVNTYEENGQGIVHYISPYARYQYHGKLMVSCLTGSAFSHGEMKVLTNVDLKYSKPLATSYWDKAMLTARGEDLRKAIEKYVAKGGK